MCLSDAPSPPGDPAGRAPRRPAPRRRTPFRTPEPLRPSADSWEGPYFRLFQCGMQYSEVHNAPHALFMDAMEPEGSWIYVLSGALYYRKGPQRYRVEAGQALVTRRPDPGWLLRPAGAVPLYTIWLHVTGEPALRIFDYLHLRFGQIQSLPIGSDAVRHARHLVHLASRQPHRSAHFWSEQTFRWLNAWWRIAQDHHRAVENKQLEAVHPSRLLSYTPRTITNFAAEMGYSRSYLTRRLGRQWGCSPGKVLRQVRLEESAHLLRTTGLSIRDIAQKVGYTTTAAFSRAFTRHFRQSPQLYRRLGADPAGGQ